VYTFGTLEHDPPLWAQRAQDAIDARDTAALCEAMATLDRETQTQTQKTIVVLAQRAVCSGDVSCLSVLVPWMKIRGQGEKRWGGLVALATAIAIAERKDRSIRKEGTTTVLRFLLETAVPIKPLRDMSARADLYMLAVAGASCEEEARACVESLHVRGGRFFPAPPAINFFRPIYYRRHCNFRLVEVEVLANFDHDYESGRVLCVALQEGYLGVFRRLVALGAPWSGRELERGASTGRLEGMQIALEAGATWSLDGSEFVGAAMSNSAACFAFVLVNCRDARWDGCVLLRILYWIRHYRSLCETTPDGNKLERFARSTGLSLELAMGLVPEHPSFARQFLMRFYECKTNALRRAKTAKRMVARLHRAATCIKRAWLKYTYTPLPGRLGYERQKRAWTAKQ